ncbi:MAG: S41 family peptidase [Alphaproteobacteria bacterium]
MKRFNLVAIVLAVVLLSLPFPAATEKSNETYRQLDLFGTVFERVRAQYVEKADDKALIEAAIEGMLRSLDPHSSYMSPESFAEMQTQTRGEFGGLGIEVSQENGVIKVVSPIDETPAARAGILAGDLITHIDGETVVNMSLRDAVSKMRGKVGTRIKLTIRRGKQAPFDVTLTRAVITIQSVRARLEGNLIYVRVTQFTEQSDQGLIKAMEKYKAELGPKFAGVVLDLRNNPGGLLDQAVSISDAFLDKGEIVSTRGRDPELGTRFNAKVGDLADGKPIVVLVNAGSASASEIVAGALQDHRRAIIMGVQTFGKGSVQTIIPLGGRGAMRLTTARYYTPSGKSIQGKGITPDIVVEQARLEAIKTEPQRKEADLPKALDVKRPEKKDDNATEPKKDEPKKIDQVRDPNAPPATPQEDYQLQRAIDLLRGIALLQSRSTPTPPPTPPTPQQK